MSQAALEAIFKQQFGGEPEVRTIAPGRINLIGEHTDYNEGYVFPAAIDKQLRVVARTTQGPSRLYSEELGEGEPFRVEELWQGSVEGWAAYVAGVAWALRQHGFEDLPNIEAALDSDIPIGSGVSSSAALELAFAVLWNEIARLALDSRELAKIGQYCENRFVGVNSGIMDQMASAMGRAGHALFLDTKTLEIHYARLPAGVTIVLCDTSKPRALTDSAYNERRSQCEEAARKLEVTSLRHASPETVESARSMLGDLVYRRAKHVVTENERCVRFRDALERGDLSVLGPLMRQSHESLRLDYEVSSPELDAMAEAASAAPGCLGARMTGAGFGGACVALVEQARLQDFMSATTREYSSRTRLEPSLLACEAVDGARVL
ncbi:MAG TPA: galactokinase [Fimbriimonadaceae bacterium]|nr:galactokinase [Fimbriimonadaceae bacterium]